MIWKCHVVVPDIALTMSAIALKPSPPDDASLICGTTGCQPFLRQNAHQSSTIRNIGILLDQLERIVMTNSNPPKPGAAEIATLLRRAIASGTYMVNDRLPPERALAESHGVARGTVREALNRLAREGRVEIRPGSGSYVARAPAGDSMAAIGAANPLELMDARVAIEPHV
ncbi:MAG: winged helix-turn-helix domain-containing protein, partial [Roseovarius sp.]|nr:winged helix-turn-helix domain-containing protein [Roseovarius sp.]